MRPSWTRRWRLVGINNRDLRSFETSLDTTLRLVATMGGRSSDAGAPLVVTESGIHTRNDVAAMQAAGVHAFLIGEAFMRAEYLTLPSARALAHWSAPENRPTFTRRVRADLDLLAGATLLLLAAVLAATVAGLVTLSVLLSVVYTIGVVGYVGYMAFGARYRVPATTADTRS